jgi:hypothetical protein
MSVSLAPVPASASLGLHPRRSALLARAHCSGIPLTRSRMLFSLCACVPPFRDCLSFCKPAGELVPSSLPSHRLHWECSPLAMDELIAPDSRTNGSTLRSCRKVFQQQIKVAEPVQQRSSIHSFSSNLPFSSTSRRWTRKHTSRAPPRTSFVRVISSTTAPGIFHQCD